MTEQRSRFGRAVVKLRWRRDPGAEHVHGAVAAIGIHYRALLAPLVTLTAIAITYLLTVRVAWIGQQLGVAVPREVQPVIVMLLFGVLTDYAIFFLSRFRLRLGEGRHRRWPPRARPASWPSR